MSIGSSSVLHSGAAFWMVEMEDVTLQKQTNKHVNTSRVNVTSFKMLPTIKTPLTQCPTAVWRSPGSAAASGSETSCRNLALPSLFPLRSQLRENTEEPRCSRAGGTTGSKCYNQCLANNYLYYYECICLLFMINRWIVWSIKCQKKSDVFILWLQLTIIIVLFS